MHGGFGFPDNSSHSTSGNYRADTSKHKTELILILKKSENLWTDDKF
jgi:hypothetical protein